MGVLVTGAAGYIGSHMVLALLEGGERVIGVDDLRTGFRCAVPPEARLVVADVGEGEAMRKLMAAEKVDAVIHFAGSVVVPESVAQRRRRAA